MGVEAAAEYTGLSDPQLRRAVKRGDLVATKPAGPTGPLMFTRRDLDMFLDGSRTTHIPKGFQQDERKLGSSSEGLRLCKARYFDTERECAMPHKSTILGRAMHDAIGGHLTETGSENYLAWWADK